MVQEIQNPTGSIASGSESGSSPTTKKNSEKNSVKVNFRLRLTDLLYFHLDHHPYTARSATHQQFRAFIETLVPLKGENLDTWTVEERRDFLNWCLEKTILRVEENRLVVVEEEPTLHNVGGLSEESRHEVKADKGGDT